MIFIYGANKFQGNKLVDINMQISETNKQLLYLYLASLHDGKYENILQLLLENILQENLCEINQNTNIPVVERELFELENKCKLYEEKIEELKIR